MKKKITGIFSGNQKPCNMVPHSCFPLPSIMGRTVLGMVICSVLAIFLISVGSSAYAQNELKVAFDNWPPFADPTEKDSGICCALVKTILEPSGYVLDYEVLPAKRIYKYLKDGHTNKIDATPVIWCNKEREKYLLFSKPFLFNSIHFFVKSDSKIEYETLDKLKGYSIGVLKGYYSSDAFEKADYLKKVSFNECDQIIRLLDMGRIDMGMLDKIVAETIIKKQKLDGRLKMLRKPLSRLGLHFAVSKKHPQGTRIIKDFNKGLESIMKNRKYKSILDAYGVSSE